MTIEHNLNTPNTLAGLEIDGKPTILSIFTAQQLRGSPFLPGLVKTINLAYAQAEQSKPALGFSRQNPRLSSIDGIFVYLQDGPDSLVIVLSHQGSSDVVATATCRRYLGPDENKSPWLCSHLVEDDTEEWELRLLASHPSAQGRGAAAFVLKATEQEIMDRFAVKTKATTRPPLRRLKMVLCVVQELFSDFYKRKGYQEDYVHQRGEGYNFSIMFMSKTLAALP